MATTWKAHFVEVVLLTKTPAPPPLCAGPLTARSSPPNFCQPLSPSSKPPLTNCRPPADRAARGGRARGGRAGGPSGLRPARQTVESHVSLTLILPTTLSTPSGAESVRLNSS